MLCIANEIVPVVIRLPSPTIAIIGTGSVLAAFASAPVQCMEADAGDTSGLDLFDGIGMDIGDLFAAAASDANESEELASVSDEQSSDAADGDNSDDMAQQITCLRVDQRARHDFLGEGVVLAIGSTGEVANGVLTGDATFASLNLDERKVLFRFMKTERVQGRGPARYKDVSTTRPVFADSLTPVVTGMEGEAADKTLEDGDATCATPDSAFSTMMGSASSRNAFSHGLDGPELAKHERMRKQAKLKDAPVRGRNKTERKTKEPDVDPQVRVDAFPNQSLVKLNGKLYCLACKTDRSVRLSSLKAHLDSDAHKKKLEVRKDSLVDDGDVGGLVSRYFEKNPGADGHTLNKDLHVFRWHVMESFMYAGIASAKIDMVRFLLERAGFPLTSSTHLSQFYIPLIEDREIKRLVNELFQQHFAFIFDGTTRLGEAVNMITRTITYDFHIRLRLVAFKTTAKHMNGHELCRLIMKVLQKQCSLDLDYCIAFARDSCSTNGTAVEGLLTHSINAANMLCFPHTLHNTGKHLNIPVLEQFITPWLQIVMQPGAANTRWKSIIDGPVPGFSKVRWWSRWEIMKQVAENFSQLPAFLNSLDDDDIGDATTKKMLDVLNNNKDALELELAAVLSCERLCTATYRLEGDGLELLLVHQTIEVLRAFGATLGNDASDLPSVAALLRQRHKIDKGTTTYEWFEAPHSAWFTGRITRMPTAAKATYQITYSDGGKIEYEEREVRNWIDVRNFPEWKAAVAAVKEAYTYLENRITNNCQAPYHCAASYEVCRVSQLFDPSFAAANLTPRFVDELCASIPALKNSAAVLKAEVDAYRVAARTAPAMDHRDVHAFTEAVLTFWRTHGTKMPEWRKAARIILAIPPTSAASERVFSLLESMFGKDQISSLADLIQGALMLRYNQRRVG